MRVTRFEISRLASRFSNPAPSVLRAELRLEFYNIKGCYRAGDTLQLELF